MTWIGQEDALWVLKRRASTRYGADDHLAMVLEVCKGGKQGRFDVDLNFVRHRPISRR
jgi:hypothetical protein